MSKETADEVPSQDTQVQEMQVTEATELSDLDPRRGARSRTLTEKGKGFQQAKLEELVHQFNSAYAYWKTQTRLLKKVLMEPVSSNIIQQELTALENKISNLNGLYESYRAIDTPDQDMLRKADKCREVSKCVILNAHARLLGAQGEQIWPTVSSVFDSTTSSISLSSSNPVSNRPREPSQSDSIDDSINYFVLYIAVK